MIAVSATDYAIRSAAKKGTLRVEPKWSERFKEYHYVISDHYGIIEVHLTSEAAVNRLFDVLNKTGRR